MKIDLDKIRREALRWQVIMILDLWRPERVHEAALLMSVRDVYPTTTEIELRRALEYLESRRLVDIHRDPSGPWMASLSRTGMDIAEYTIDCEPGIARPAKYW